MKHRRERLPFLLYGWAVLALAAPARAAGGLEIVPDAGLLLLLLLAFVLLIFPVNALLFRPVFRVLDAREERIAGTRRGAEKVAGEADAAVARYESAVAETRRQLAGERAERMEQARREAASETAQARESAEREIESARQELGRTLGSVRDSLRSEAESLAREAAARLLGRAL